MKKGIRVLLLLMVVLLLIPLTSGCVKQRGLVNEDGEMWELSPGELEDGYYIKNGTVFNIPLVYGLTFTTPKDTYAKDRVVWICSYDKYIPVLTRETQLILFSPDKYPEEPLIMEHFAPECYSLGAIFIKEEDGTLRFPNSDAMVCPDSGMAKAIAGEVKNRQASRITELNKQPFPLQIIGDAGYVRGLTKGGRYQIGFYEGTKYRQFYVAADTQIFLQDASYTLTQYEQTKEGYFIMKILPEMPNGLYCLNGESLIYYTGSDYNSVQTPTPTELPTPEPERTPIVSTIESSAPSREDPTPMFIPMEEVK